ncbi:hypothetical protein J2X04_002209 [Lysobacter niabensis]|uniref:Uncharacterized protein n=1 Tax=Agrilutibacter niabensis TaxID=380628 RepID=A0ABU1VQS3_9GAMM|nr:DUF2188 domain-containing protein [Lysobacter niabensis]MDR7099828.1 hypothetical protein [Lysobacter niabensis]
MIFLIHYNRSTRRLVSILPFLDREEAGKAKLEKELSLLPSSNGHEVVLLEAADEESLRKTHRRYFESLTAIGAGESAAYDASKARFVKHWNVRQDRSGWRVQAEGMPDARYPTKESAFAAAAKDAKGWNRATGNATSVRLWGEDGSITEEVTYEPA